MTSSYIPQLSFSFYRHRLIRADFSGGQITSDAGLLPLRALISGMGLLAVWQNPSVILAKRSVFVTPCCRCFVNASTRSSLGTGMPTTRIGYVMIRLFRFMLINRW